MRWQDALERQAALCAVMRKQAISDAVLHGTAWRDFIVHVLEESPTFYSEPDVTALLEGAWRSIPADTLVTEEILPTSCGCWFFQPAIEVMPGDGGEVADWIEGLEPPTKDEFRTYTSKAHLLAWSVVSGRLVLILFSVPAWDGVYDTTKLYTLTASVRTGATLADADAAAEEYGEANRASLQLVRILITCSLFARQRIIVPTPCPVDRATYRRVQRETKHAHPSRDVIVVTLRQVRHANADATDHERHEHSLRWWVAGHWRVLKHARFHGTRTVWVRPHVKGPDEAPLAPPKHHVFAVVR